jgi:hypothetical protein
MSSLVQDSILIVLQVLLVVMLVAQRWLHSAVPIINSNPNTAASVA